MHFLKLQRIPHAGFTIVELLVVVVIVVMLATITVVAYTRVRSEAMTEKNKTNTLSVKKVAEGYYTRYNAYPTSVSHLTASHVTFPSGVVLLQAGQQLNATNGENTVVYKYVLTDSSATGACMYYWSYLPPPGDLSWDYAPAAGQPGRSEPLYLGTANHSNCSADGSKGIGISP